MEGSFAGIVEAEEEDGVFCALLEMIGVGEWRGKTFFGCGVEIQPFG